MGLQTRSLFCSPSHLFSLPCRPTPLVRRSSFPLARRTVLPLLLLLLPTCSARAASAPPRRRPSWRKSGRDGASSTPTLPSGRRAPGRCGRGRLRCFGRKGSPLRMQSTRRRCSRRQGVRTRRSTRSRHGAVREGGGVREERGGGAEPRRRGETRTATEMGKEKGGVEAA